MELDTGGHTSGSAARVADFHFHQPPPGLSVHVVSTHSTEPMALGPRIPVDVDSIAPSAWASLSRADLEATTSWDFPDQSWGDTSCGDPSFHGVTPARCVVNLVRRYSRPRDVIVDAMAGSGTVSDVARALGRRPVAFDIVPRRRDIIRADARAWPLPDRVAALTIIDSPYSNNVAYSEDRHCLGRISCRDSQFYDEMDRVASEARRILRPGGVLAWIVCDEYRGGVFTPVGFHLFDRLRRSFIPIDTVSLVRRNDRSLQPMWEHRARRFNFLLRGFKYLFILRKPSEGQEGA